MICVNASNRAAGLRLPARARARRRGGRPQRRDGAAGAPGAARRRAILARCTALPLAEIPRFAFAEAQVAGRRALVAHTGYTGEDGWELYCRRRRRGARCGTRCSRPARPTASARPGSARATRCASRRRCRCTATSSALDTSPLEARLGWVVQLDKGDFIGREALLARTGGAVRAAAWSASSLSTPASPRAGLPRPARRPGRSARSPAAPSRRPLARG